MVTEALVVVALAGSAHPAASFFGVPVWVWAVLVSMSASAFTVGGFVLQKKASMAAVGWKVGDITISPLWLLGFMLGIIVPIPGEVAAYSMAPMSLTTPLSGVSVALNMVLAPRLLGERLQRWPDMAASLMILMGTVLTTAAGSHHDGTFNFSELACLIGQPAFLWALAGLLCTVASCIRYMASRQPELEKSAKARPLNPNIFEVSLPAVAAAGSGCLTNIALKGTGELIRNRAGILQCTIWLAAAVPPALAQLNYVNRGLRLYPQTVFFPIYSALLVFTNTLYGLIFFREYTALLCQEGRVAAFTIGVLTIMLGVILFTFRRSEGDGASRAAAPSRSPAAVDPEVMSYLAPPKSVNVKASEDASLYVYLLPDRLTSEIESREARDWHVIVD